jgi:bifunctional non-homologous end joining protein LigD
LRGHKLHGHWTLVRMKGRGNGREDPWLLIKERDAFARPAAEFSVVDEMPDSVQSLADRPDPVAAPGRAAPAPAPAPASSGPPEGAKPARLPATLQP